MLLKIVVSILLVLSLSSANYLGAQYKYSIDIETTKARKVTLKFKIEKTKEFLKANAEYRKKKRIENKTSRKIRKHAYNIQKHEVKKRMRKSRRIAECHNKGTVPFSIKLKSWLQWMM